MLPSNSTFPFILATLIISAHKHYEQMRVQAADCKTVSPTSNQELSLPCILTTAMLFVYKLWMEFSKAIFTSYSAKIWNDWARWSQLLQSKGTAHITRLPISSISLPHFHFCSPRIEYRFKKTVLFFSYSICCFYFVNFLTIK